MVGSDDVGSDDGVGVGVTDGVGVTMMPVPKLPVCRRWMAWSRLSSVAVTGVSKAHRVASM